MGDKRWVAGAAVLAAGLAAAPVQGASAFDPYSSFGVIGDSLSDNGNVFDLTDRVLGFGYPPEPYFEGRFSNGPVYADVLADQAKDAGLPTRNFAFGGAQAVTEVSSPIDIPDIEQQALVYALDFTFDRGDRPLVAIYAGANDLFGGISDGQGEAAALEAADAIGDVAGDLASVGVGDVMLLNLGDLGRVPRYTLRQPDRQAEASAATAAFNTALAAEAEALRGDGLRVIEVDVATTFDALFADPSAFGIEDAVNPCGVASDDNIFGLTLNDFSDCDFSVSRAFFDEVHPSAIVHGEIASLALDALGGDVTPPTAPAHIPLPLPAGLLGVSLAALAGLRRARAS